MDIPHIERHLRVCFPGDQGAQALQFAREVGLSGLKPRLSWAPWDSTANPIPEFNLMVVDNYLLFFNKLVEGHVPFPLNSC